MSAATDCRVSCPNCGSDNIGVTYVETNHYRVNGWIRGPHGIEPAETQHEDLGESSDGEFYCRECLHDFHPNEAAK